MTVLPAMIFVISDRIQGHLSQSGGVARWISRLTGAEVAEMDVPRLSGWEGLRLLKWKARFLPRVDGRGAAQWLQEAGAAALFERALSGLAAKNLPPVSALFLSAGSAAAPYTLALAKATGQRSAVVMTPSVLGTAPFDFAIVPAHDHPKKGKNLLTTLGAPNMIDAELLETEGRSLASRLSSRAGNKWGVLIGGDDGNYSIPPEWAERVLKPLLETAEKTGADVLITTSRRTSSATEEKIVEMVRGSPSIRMLVLGTKDPWNPVPAMLGACQRIFCTEDSVSMISEAATGGHVAHILRVERKKGLRKCLQDLTTKMVDKNLLARRRLWGVPRFDLMIESFRGRGLAREYNPTKPDEAPPAQGRRDEGLSFNEAKRAAEWIIQRWKT
ncbi:MAG TPA: ELM1/GtrOC1 family putative glycosyltransferase [Synergistales bacterium]|nr:ELM1/GtrOC1 family putative glycosyltransferase [Synergistales bacterium]